MLPSYATPTDPHPSATMTKSLHNQLPNANDGQFYPIYNDFSDLSNAGETAAAAPGERGGEPVHGFSTMSQTAGAFPHNWYYGMGDFELFLPPSPPDIVRGEQGQGPPPQVPWECRTQAYPALMGGTVAMANSISRYFPADESMDGYYEQAKWPPPPMGQISPSPSQSSHYDSSPASGCGPQFPRHNGCSSIPASRAAAVEESPFDARFRPVPEQLVSPGDGPMTPGGTRAGGGSHIFTESRSSAGSQTTRPPRRNAKNQTITTTTTTTDYNAGTLSPAATPSPKDGTAAAAAAAALYQPAPHSAHRTRGQHTPRRSSGNSRPTAQQKQEERPGLDPRPTQRARNREAANKCRAKTKLAVVDLESTEAAMSAENRELSATARGLRDEVLRLKNELLSHANCDDDLIQRYLTNQARMVGGGGAVAQQQQQQKKIPYQRH